MGDIPEEQKSVFNYQWFASIACIIIGIIPIIVILIKTAKHNMRKEMSKLNMQIKKLESALMNTTALTGSGSNERSIWAYCK